MFPIFLASPLKSVAFKLPNLGSGARQKQHQPQPLYLTFSRSRRASAEPPRPPPPFAGSFEEPLGVVASFMVSIRDSFSFSRSPILPTRMSKRSLGKK